MERTSEDIRAALCLHSSQTPVPNSSTKILPMSGEPGPLWDITDWWKDLPRIVSELVFQNLPHTWTLCSFLRSGKLS